MEKLAELLNTDFTPTTHKKVYPAISPTRPELSQAGRGVLITGGGTGIGKAIAESFVTAAASHVIIVGRRLDVLNAAAASLAESAQNTGSPSKILTYKVDVTSKTDITTLFEDLAAKDITVDVLVLNAAKFPSYTPLLELGMDELWTHLEANVRGPMFLTERFMKQNAGKQKFLVNVSTSTIHTQHHPMLISLSPYTFSKLTGTLFVQLLSIQVPIEELQVVSFHPGAIFSDGTRDMGLTEDVFPFDQASLPGAFAVWAASKEAAFVHNRMVWASWDVNELASGNVRKRIEEDEDYLRISVVGFTGSNRSK